MRAEKIKLANSLWAGKFSEQCFKDRSGRSVWES